MDKVQALQSFSYSDGKLFWKYSPSRSAKKGNEAGYNHKDGYRCIQLDGKSYMAHRIVYLMHYGEIPKGMQIDHINHNRSDNRIENLRIVDNKENQYNKKAAKGCRLRKCGRWEARITVDGKQIALGYYSTEEEASSAYKKAKKELHIIPNRKEISYE